MEYFGPHKQFDLANLNFPFYFGRDLVDLEEISSKPLKSAVLANGEYGLVTLPPRAKKVSCSYPCKMSRDCCHVEVFENFVQAESVQRGKKSRTHKKGN